MPHAALVLRRSLLASVLLCVGSAAAAPQAGAGNPAIAPVDRLRESWWAQRHSAVLAQVKANPNIGLVLLGDSITQNYEKAKAPDENFQPAWQRFYGSRTALNAGFSGDRTEHVLWRLEHGEIDGIRPRAVVLLIGTNNTAAGQSPADVELGIDAVVDKLREKLPQASIVLLGILPSEISEKSRPRIGRSIGIWRTAMRWIPRSRSSISAHVFFRDGKLDASLFYDPRLPRPGKPLHPDTAGQRLMAEAIEPTLVRLLQDGPRQYLASLSEVNTAVIPVPRLEMDFYDWYERHRDVLSAKAHMDPRNRAHRRFDHTHVGRHSRI